MRDRLSYEGYTLVFEENFDGPELDRTRWNVELHEPGWVNEEWQEYVDSPENIRLEDGRVIYDGDASDPKAVVRPEDAGDEEVGA